MTDDDLIAFLRHIYGSDEWPKPLNILRVKQMAKAGSSDGEIARELRTTAPRVTTARRTRSIAKSMLGVKPAEVPAREEYVRNKLGELLRGRAAELAFEDIYKSTTHSDEFELVDVREGHSDTDYRLLNGGRRPLYRINIKFFGSNLRRGPELVGLQPEDCFPLATYKIAGALQKQNEEHLPYVFFVVGVPGLTGASIAHVIEDRYAKPLAYLTASTVPGKRKIEDVVIDRMVEDSSDAYQQAYSRIRSANWYVLSARKAQRLVEDYLYERIFALRVPSFTRAFSNAEVDMHFSLSQDLTPLSQFLDTLSSEGPAKTVGLLERGTI